MMIIVYVTGYIIGTIIACWCIDKYEAYQWNKQMNDIIDSINYQANKTTSVSKKQAYKNIKNILENRGE